MNDQKNDNLAFLFVNFVNHPPISDPITITPGKRAFQTFDVWVFIWIFPQMLEAVVQSFYERRVSALIKMPCITGEEQIIHPDGCPRSGRSPHFQTAEGFRDSGLRIQPDSAIPGSRHLLLFLRGRPKIIGHAQAIEGEPAQAQLCTAKGGFNFGIVLGHFSALPFKSTILYLFYPVL